MATAAEELARFTATHCSAVLVLVVLALGESERLDGRSALTALVAGCEAITRLGMAAPGRFHERGARSRARARPPLAARSLPH